MEWPHQTVLPPLQKRTRPWPSPFAVEPSAERHGFPSAVLRPAARKNLRSGKDESIRRRTGATRTDRRLLSTDQRRFGPGRAEHGFHRRTARPRFFLPGRIIRLASTTSTPVFCRCVDLPAPPRVPLGPTDDPAEEGKHDVALVAGRARACRERLGLRFRSSSLNDVPNRRGIRQQ